MAPRTRKSKAVAKKTDDPTALSPEMADLYGEMEGEGMEDIGSNLLTLPFLKMVQSMSPERDEDSPAYIEGAKEGTIFDSVTRTMYPHGVEVIPIQIRDRVLEWTGKKPKGTFVAEYENMAEAQESANPDHELEDTATVVVMYRELSEDGNSVEASAWNPATISFTKTKRKVVRNWATQMKMLKVPVGDVRITPPMFGTRWRLTSVGQANEHGKFYNFTVGYHGLVQDAKALKDLREFRDSIADKAIRHHAEAEGEDEDTEY